MFPPFHLSVQSSNPPSVHSIHLPCIQPSSLPLSSYLSTHVSFLPPTPLAHRCVRHGVPGTVVVGSEDTVVNVALEQGQPQVYVT